MTIEEKWRFIEGYSPYEISTLGRLRRIGKILTTPISKIGYQRKYLKDKKKNLLLHRAIAVAFIPNPLNLPQVNHKDGDKSNNKIDNLEWVTASQNIQHCIDTGLKTIQKGEEAGRSKLTNLQVSIIREALNLNHKQFNIARYFGLDQSTISLIKSRKNWASI